MAKQVTIKVDHENNAEQFWDVVHGLSEDGLEQVVPASLKPLLRDGKDVTVPKADAQELRDWLATLHSEVAYGGPEYARDPFVFSDE